MPNIITYIFMLFCSISADDLGLWEQMAIYATVEDSMTFWAQVVGVDLVHASDHGLFCILEWGGMEIK
jgi:hypothetical protein